MQYLFTAILAFSAVRAHFTIIEPAMSRKMAEHVCKSYGMQLAELTLRNMQLATAELKGAGLHETWISTPKGTTILKVGNVGEDNTIGHEQSQRMKATALCQSSTPGKKSTKRLHKRAESSSTPGKKYLHRLRPYQPPRVIDLGISSFKMPEKDIHARAGVYGKPGSAKRARHISPTSSESSSSVPAKRKNVKKNCGLKEKPRFGKKSAPEKSCKKKCRKTGRPSPFLNRLSLSSSSRSVSIEINFSQEDGALLGSCDQPAIVFHTRHYSRRLRISSSSNSVSVARQDIF